MRVYALCHSLGIALCHKIKTVRVYLRTKKLSIDLDSDGEMQDGPFDSISQPQEDTAQQQSPQTFSLIGSSEDRKTLKEKQDEEYQMSLEMDKKPTGNEHYEICDKEPKEQLQDAHKARVVPEPCTNFVAVKIRHPSLGLLSRRFPHNTKMHAVYDWAGSLCTDPAYFILTDPSSGNIIQPSSLVYDKYTLNMVESSNRTPSLLESDDEVQFLGFG
ncbi:Hypothetical predicted protein [Paramuricea clavata]|uniref:Uncharacterized protein n=1 Tax=Paramuricea clavata TaxID=317549 RepID=A0A7D9EDA4_PARCT|nr:Hypothetical predicted protein [Paramuricea clavata]